jgi:sialate O-acetylesterase
MNRYLSGLLMVLLLAITTGAEPLRLARIFADHMVIQRELPVNIWGWADAGDNVEVVFSGQTARAVADADGKWMAVLPAMKANPVGQDITVKTDKQPDKPLTIRDVLVGEVWFTAGQSNMMMGLSSADGGADGFKRLDACANIRVVNLPGQELQSAAPAKDLTRDAQWQKPGGGYSAVSGFFAEKLYSHFDGKVPVGMITAAAIVPAEAWVDEISITSSPMLKNLMNSALKMTTKWYNGTICPLSPYTIRGVLYYQGEYNSGRGPEFEVLFPALINSWRSSFKQKELPFLFVQLPGFIEHRGEKDSRLDMDAGTLAALHKPAFVGSWADFREAQLNVYKKMPKTGMAVTIDIGDPYNIHPKMKEPVADRLLLIARQMVYGEKNEGNSPIPIDIKVDKNKFIVTFKNIGEGLNAADGVVKGFDIAGQDMMLYPAQAKIEGKDKVVVWSDKTDNPVVLHYAWGGYPLCSLYNSEKLPASPFRYMARDKIKAADSVSFNFKNASFEKAPENNAENVTDWVLAKGAARTNEKASDGQWSLKLPGKDAAISQSNMAPPLGNYWNSNPLLKMVVRPGCVSGYSVDIASADENQKTIYMRLCKNPQAEGYQFWGGIPLILTASTKFEKKEIANIFSAKFDFDFGGNSVDTAGAIFVNQSKVDGAVYMDNLSEITLLRPLLNISGNAPIILPAVNAGETALSEKRIVSNSQKQTMPRKLNNEETQQVATVLYGAAGFKISENPKMQKINDASDDIGAIIMGNDAKLFEFSGDHVGVSPQSLRFVGADGKSGLVGGLKPESEEIVIKFKGSDTPGEYKAVVRIITQAMNTGTMSDGQSGEPPVNLFYTDIPVSVKVKK